MTRDYHSSRMSTLSQFYHQPSVAVCPNPVLFQVPKETIEDTKENPKLPYRSIFAVLTWDSVVVYDTVHSSPLAMVKGLHYCNLTDGAWSADGHSLVVCSTDGYVSIITFDEGELGEVYTPPEETVEVTSTAESSVPEPVTTPKTVSPPASNKPPSLPPCEPGSTTTLEGRPAKKAKVRVTPTLLTKRPAEEAAHAVNQLSLDKKKKRVQPMLVSK